MTTTIKPVSVVGYRDPDAEDLFEIETTAREIARNHEHTLEFRRRVVAEAIYAMRLLLAIEESLAKTAKLLGDEKRHDIAWRRMVFANTIVKSLEVVHSNLC